MLSAYPSATIRASVSSIACAGWKVLGRDHSVECVNSWDFPEWLEDVNDDRRVCEAICEIIWNADAVVTHNGKRFDWKFLQTRFLKHDLPPAPPIHHIDTCSEAKRALLMVNNRMQTLATFYTDEEKMDHEGWPLWVKVHGGIPRVRDEDAEQRMTEYCKQDIITLEAVFNEIRPVVKSLPNYNLFSPFKEKSCPHCGSTRLESKRYAYTKTKRKPQYICLDCRGVCHTSTSDELPR